MSSRSRTRRSGYIPDPSCAPQIPVYMTPPESGCPHPPATIQSEDGVIQVSASGEDNQDFSLAVNVIQLVDKLSRNPNAINLLRSFADNHLVSSGDYDPDTNTIPLVMKDGSVVTINFTGMFADSDLVQAIVAPVPPPTTNDPAIPAVHFGAHTAYLGRPVRWIRFTVSGIPGPITVPSYT